ncbi:MAG: hypothetical protein PHY93_14655 [Bacteriovorax sp.]|nr:hypothetical protein [Bacteriovorax sp.]
MKKTFIHLGLGIIGLISILSLQSCQGPGVRKPSSGGNEFINSKNIESQYQFMNTLSQE